MTNTTRDLIQRLADELDHYKQLLMDDRRKTHPLADEARAFLAQPEPKPPSWRDAMLNDITRCHGIDCHQRHQCARHTAPMPDNVLFSWVSNLNPERAHLCSYFIVS